MTDDDSEVIAAQAATRRPEAPKNPTPQPERAAMSSETKPTPNRMQSHPKVISRQGLDKGSQVHIGGRIRDVIAIEGAFVRLKAASAAAPEIVVHRGMVRVMPKS